MEKTVEDVLAEALECIQQQGSIDIDEYTQRYPELAEDLQEVLPVLIAVRANRDLHRTALKTSTHAKSLFSELHTNYRRHRATLGVLLQDDLDKSGLPVGDKAEQMGLPEDALRKLLDDNTPADTLDNTTIKRLAEQVAAPVGAMIKELRRIVALYRSVGLAAEPPLLFTRSGEESSLVEQQKLLERVRRQDAPGDKSPTGGR